MLGAPLSHPAQNEELGVPFFRPDITESEVSAVVDVLRSGWLTSGPRAREFEHAFAGALGARQAVAVSSCTAALHLSLAALGVRPGDGVLVPTMTFAATAEAVRYQGAIPILVDCDPETLLVDLDDAERKLTAAERGEIPSQVEGPVGSWSPGTPLRVVGFIPVHVAGAMVDLDALDAFAKRHGLWIVEDSAHAFPAGWRRNSSSPWRSYGRGTASTSCFSFYANKSITTGEGGMVVTDDDELADRIRLLSLHGMSRPAWARLESTTDSWDYQIAIQGFKYNLSDVAAALGLRQLERAESMRRRRQKVAGRYREAFVGRSGLMLPPTSTKVRHSHHLFFLQLPGPDPESGRRQLFAELSRRRIGHAVHWRPLHLQPLYARGWDPVDFPASTDVWRRLFSLPIFPGQTNHQIECVIAGVEAFLSRSTTPP